MDLTTANFDTEVLESKIPVVVLWGSPANVPSNILYMRLLRTITQDKKLGRVNIEANAELAMRFSIRNLPYVMLFVNGLAIVAETDYEAFMAGVKAWNV